METVKTTKLAKSNIYEGNSLSMPCMLCGASLITDARLQILTKRKRHNIFDLPMDGVMTTHVVVYSANHMDIELWELLTQGLTYGHRDMETASTGTGI